MLDWLFSDLLNLAQNRLRMDDMQGFFDGFDKVKLLLGTSIFYLAALILIGASISINQFVGLRKSTEFHKESNLPTTKSIAEVVGNKIYTTELGYRVNIPLVNKDTFKSVSAQVDSLMRAKDFEPLSIVVNCTRVDCWVIISVTDVSQFALAKRASEQLN